MTTQGILQHGNLEMPFVFPLNFNPVDEFGCGERFQGRKDKVSCSIGRLDNDSRGNTNLSQIVAYSIRQPEGGLEVTPLSAFVRI